jgi:hypothetical protein
MRRKERKGGSWKAYEEQRVTQKVQKKSVEATEKSDSRSLTSRTPLGMTR